MKKDTLLISPDVYKDIIKPNTIDLNNSFSDELDIKHGRFFKYKRGDSINNRLALATIVSKIYNRDIKEILVLNSGVASATLISISDEFNKIYYLQNTYPEMIDAYNLKGKAIELTDLNKISKNDIICLESCSIPYCIDNKEYIKNLVEKAHSIGAYVLVDNSCYTGLVFNPFEYNVDFVIESLSKCSCGYNTSMLGVLMTNEKTKDKFSKMKDISKIFSFYPHPIDCYFTILGLQTLRLRLNKIKDTTEKICKYLKQENINYYSITETGIILIESIKSIQKIETIKKVKLFQKADTFGVNFSVITGFENTNFFRLSIGLEEAEDLIEALSEIIDDFR